jgi:3-oxoacyl-[acyl-carrier protein] reductase
MISLKDKISVVTGGSRGIGAATALLLAKAGSDIVLSYARHADRASAVAAEIRNAGRQAEVFRADLVHAHEATALIERAIALFGTVDIVVNNAGIWTQGEMGVMPEEVWDETMAVNLKSVFNVCNAVVPYMQRSGGGRIVNIASTAGQRGEAFHSHYAASKGAVLAFTKSIAVELAPHNILVNAVAPGWVDTEMTGSALGDTQSREAIAATIPLNRIATAEDVAGSVLFLASDLARHITGSTISVNGGSVLV